MFANPTKNVEAFHIDPGMKVADIGAGTGHYALALAKRVGDIGRVYAIDVQKELLTKLKKEAAHRHVHNIEVVHGNAEVLHGTHLKDALLDRVIVSNVLFQIEDKDTFAQEIFRIMRPNSKLYVIDWTDSFGGIGPHSDHVVPMYAARELFEHHGFASITDFIAGEHHYGIAFRKI